MESGSKDGKDVPGFREDLGKRIRLVEQKFKNREEAARVAGVAKSTLANWIAGLADPSFASLARLAKATDTSLDWLASGISQTPLVSAHDVESVILPRVATELSGGPGSFLDGSNIVDQIGFSKKWLAERLGSVDVRNLCIVGVVGDSMEPTIHQGDDLMIDISVTSLLDNAIYAMRWDDALVVKRLQRLMDGLVIISDNSAYSDQTIDQKQMDRLHIVGRVRWIGKVI
ncbi:helix-turn-helix transcriptional regulator [Marivibrio halodurans]|uniref:Helix-turn-helix transcriptional regulator n=1 Tax=Marivibrio halodurans TaxID=2039722 RepID=A0A8J7SM86_9PROT|nr:S24 family peptidase [Marivibrio halodurans]MBP5857253.1 helix-turn-helix transcriptional regulator [Marivibrio halodurans]